MSVYPLLSSQIELPAFKYARGVGGVKSFFTLHGLQEYDVKTRLAYKLSSKKGTVMEENKISGTAVAGDRALIKCTFFPTRMWDIWYLNVEPTDRTVPEVFGKTMRVIECLVRFEPEEGMTSIGASLEDPANLSPGRGEDSETNGIRALASGGASPLNNKDKKFSCMDDPPGEDVEKVDTATGIKGTDPFFDENSSGGNDNSLENYMNMESKPEEAGKPEEENFEYFEVERTQDSVSSVHDSSRKDLYRDAQDCLKVAKDLAEKLEQLVEQAKNFSDHH